MRDEVEVITVNATNVQREGFLCYKSKSKTEGYQRKLNWLKDGFREGLTIKLLHLRAFEGRRGSFGFIEYTPGEYAWRAVNAQDYLLIHCLWVIGRHKGKGYGSRLVNSCLDDAQRLRKAGVAMVTSRERGWLAGRQLLLKNGFELVDHAPPSFDLLVKKIQNASSPTFPTDWEARAARYGSGLTVVRSDQCPYIDALVKSLMKVAGERRIESREVELRSANEVQAYSPCAYGVFSLVYDGKLLTYHPIGGQKLLEHLEGQGREPEQSRASGS